MKGIVLAGGLGTRFHPVTRVVNKHLLDVFDEPMIFHPIRRLAEADIVEVVLVTGKSQPQFKELLGDGSDFGVTLHYALQESTGGIAEALARAAAHVGKEKVVVLLGDNVFQEDLRPYIESFKSQKSGARILLKEVSAAEADQFGIAIVEGDRITKIIEKPSQASGTMAVTGCYMYDHRVFEIISGLDPSARGELEITDVNNLYIERGEMAFDVVNGWWIDAGTPASKLKASIMVASTKGFVIDA